jgi:hypothetical protein
MVTAKRWLRHLGLWLSCGLFSLGLFSCGDRPASLIEEVSEQLTDSISTISRAATPAAIAELSPWLAEPQPQLTILSPRPEAVIEDTRVSVRFQVSDLPIYKDETWGLGPHLHVILDNQPYIPVYSLEEPLILDNLSAGTHTLRVFAARPWHESFKNDGAYAQTTFHVFTQTAEPRPVAGAPLLTYSRPTGSYGAEPILLDYYLTDAPLHMVAQETSGLTDWRVRCTVNGQSLIFDQWEPVYLSGFKPGKNWVQLELIDPQGNPIPNAFNNTARVITYEPGGEDTLSRLVRGELSLAEIGRIVDPTYEPPLPPPPPILEPPAPEPLPAAGPSETPPVEKPSEPLVQEPATKAPAFAAPASEPLTVEESAHEIPAVEAPPAEPAAPEPSTRLPIESIGPAPAPTETLPTESPALSPAAEDAPVRRWFERFQRDRQPDSADRETGGETGLPLEPAEPTTGAAEPEPVQETPEAFEPESLPESATGAEPEEEPAIEEIEEAETAVTGATASPPEPEVDTRNATESVPVQAPESDVDREPEPDQDADSAPPSAIDELRQRFRSYRRQSRSAPSPASTPALTAPESERVSPESSSAESAVPDGEGGEAD